jgi:hypothetical protein
MTKTDSQQRIRISLEVDQQFADYTLEMTPVEMRELAKGVLPSPYPTEMRLKFLDDIESLIPHSELHQGNHHKYLIGREAGRRTFSVWLSRVHLPKNYKFVALYGACELLAQDFNARFWVEDDGLQLYLRYSFDH